MKPARLLPTMRRMSALFEVDCCEDAEGRMGTASGQELTPVNVTAHLDGAELIVSLTDCRAVSKVCAA